MGDAEIAALLHSLASVLDLDVNAFEDAASFLSAVQSDRPGCIVLTHLANVNAVALQNELTERRCRLPVIVAIRPGDVRTAVAATRAGAFEVLERPLTTDRMLDSVRRAVSSCLEDSHVPSEKIVLGERFERLSRREREVLQLVVAGLTSRLIAEQLGLQEKTIEAYRSHLKQKMRARNTADLVRMFHNR